MQISISGQHVVISASLQDYTKDHALQIVRKYFVNAISISIVFSKCRLQFICNIMVNDGTGRHAILKSNGVSDYIHSSFDRALSRLKKLLRKYKFKFKNHHDSTKISQVIMVSRI